MRVIHAFKDALQFNGVGDPQGILDANTGGSLPMEDILDLRTIAPRRGKLAIEFQGELDVDIEKIKKQVVNIVRNVRRQLADLDREFLARITEIEFEHEIDLTRADRNIEGRQFWVLKPDRRGDSCTISFQSYTKKGVRRHKTFSLKRQKDRTLEQLLLIEERKVSLSATDKETELIVHPHGLLEYVFQSGARCFIQNGRVFVGLLREEPQKRSVVTRDMPQVLLNPRSRNRWIFSQALSEEERHTYKVHRPCFPDPSDPAVRRGIWLRFS